MVVPPTKGVRILTKQEVVDYYQKTGRPGASAVFALQQGVAQSTSQSPTTVFKSGNTARALTPAETATYYEKSGGRIYDYYKSIAEASAQQKAVEIQNVGKQTIAGQVQQQRAESAGMAVQTYPQTYTTFPLKPKQTVTKENIPPTIIKGGKVYIPPKPTQKEVGEKIFGKGRYVPPGTIPFPPGGGVNYPPQPPMTIVPLPAIPTTKEPTNTDFLKPTIPTSPIKEIEIGQAKEQSQFISRGGQFIGGASYGKKYTEENIARKFYGKVFKEKYLPPEKQNIIIQGTSQKLEPTISTWFTGIDKDTGLPTYSVVYTGAGGANRLATSEEATRLFRETSVEQAKAVKITKTQQTIRQLITGSQGEQIIDRDLFGMLQTRAIAGAKENINEERQPVYSKVIYEMLGLRKPTLPQTKLSFFGTMELGGQSTDWIGDSFIPNLNKKINKSLYGIYNYGVDVTKMGTKPGYKYGGKAITRFADLGYELTQRKYFGANIPEYVGYTIKAGGRLLLPKNIVQFGEVYTFTKAGEFLPILNKAILGKKYSKYPVIQDLAKTSLAGYGAYQMTKAETPEERVYAGLFMLPLASRLFNFGKDVSYIVRGTKVIKEARTIDKPFIRDKTIFRYERARAFNLKEPSTWTYKLRGYKPGQFVRLRRQLVTPEVKAKFEGEKFADVWKFDTKLKDFKLTKVPTTSFPFDNPKTFKSWFERKNIREFGLPNTKGLFEDVTLYEPFEPHQYANYLVAKGKLKAFGYLPGLTETTRGGLALYDFPLKGKGKGMIIYDPLIAKRSHTEFEQIISHEIGHFQTPRPILKLDLFLKKITKEKLPYHSYPAEWLAEHMIKPYYKVELKPDKSLIKDFQKAFGYSATSAGGGIREIGEAGQFYSGKGISTAFLRLGNKYDIDYTFDLNLGFGTKPYVYSVYTQKGARVIPNAYELRVPNPYKKGGKPIKKYVFPNVKIQSGQFNIPTNKREVQGILYGDLVPVRQRYGFWFGGRLVRLGEFIPATSKIGQSIVASGAEPIPQRPSVLPSNRGLSVSPSRIISSSSKRYDLKISKIEKSLLPRRSTTSSNYPRRYFGSSESSISSSASSLSRSITSISRSNGSRISSLVRRGYSRGSGYSKGSSTYGGGSSTTTTTNTPFGRIFNISTKGEKKKKKGLGSSFDVFIIEKRKPKTIARGLSEPVALDIGARAVTGSLRATFGIRKSDLPVKEISSGMEFAKYRDLFREPTRKSVYRKYGRVYVQKQTRTGVFGGRLAFPAELREIQSTKRNKMERYLR